VFWCESADSLAILARQYCYCMMSAESSTSLAELETDFFAANVIHLMSVGLHVK